MIQKGDIMTKSLRQYVTRWQFCKMGFGLCVCLSLGNGLLAEKGVIDHEKNTGKEVTDPEKDIYQWLKTYADVIGVVKKRAFKSVRFDHFIQESLKTAVSNVDAHSTFLSPADYEKTVQSTSGEFSGIGVSIMTKAPDDEALVVIDVITDGPAFKADILSGDKIVEADGHKFKGLSFDEAICKLKGKPGTEVVLKIIRGKKPLEKKVVRDIVKDQNALCYLFKKQEIYYLALRLFTENVASQVRDLLKIANQGKCKGIIFDVRRNPGGILQSAIEMCSLFIKKNSLVAVTKDKQGNVIDRYFTQSDPVLKAEVPILILIDNLTASAAEIFAGSLRYHSIQSYKQGRGKLKIFLLGVPTFGKGSVQEVIPLSNGCALKLTTMLYYLPGYNNDHIDDVEAKEETVKGVTKDCSIQAVGIAPDFLIKPKFFPEKKFNWLCEMYGKETSLKNFISFQEASGKGKDLKEGDKKDSEDAGKKGKKEDEPMTKEKMEQRFQEELTGDVQVQAAINLINIHNLIDQGVVKKGHKRKLQSRHEVVDVLKNSFMTDEKIDLEKVK